MKKIKKPLRIGRKNKNGAGRPSRWGEETKTVAFRIPISAEIEIKQFVKNVLIQKENEYKKNCNK
jgi:hypothetical protein